MEDVQTAWGILPRWKARALALGEIQAVVNAAAMARGREPEERDSSDWRPPPPPSVGFQLIHGPSRDDALEDEIERRYPPSEEDDDGDDMIKVH